MQFVKGFSSFSWFAEASYTSTVSPCMSLVPMSYSLSSNLVFPVGKMAIALHASYTLVCGIVISEWMLLITMVIMLVTTMLPSTARDNDAR